MRRDNRAAARRAAGAAMVAAMLVLAGCGDDGDDGEGGDGEAATSGQEGGDTGGSTGGATGGEETGGGAITDLPPAEIAQRAGIALRNVTSVHMVGQSGATRFDVRMDRAGNCAGNASVTQEGSFAFLKRQNEVWIEPGRDMWTRVIGDQVTPAILQQLDGMYLATTANAARGKAVARMCDLAAYQSDMGRDMGTGDLDEATKGEETVVDGVQAITLVDETPEGAQNVLVVATEGPPYPLRSVQNDDGETQMGEFSAFNRPVEVEAPPAGQVITLEGLQQGQIGQR